MWGPASRQEGKAGASGDSHAPVDKNKLKASPHVLERKMSGLWTLSVIESMVTGFSKTSLESFTLGRHNWTITRDRGCNEDINSDSFTTELKMSGCKEDQFTCNDGQCVSMNQRCD